MHLVNKVHKSKLSHYKQGAISLFNPIINPNHLIQHNEKIN